MIDNSKDEVSKYMEGVCKYKILTRKEELEISRNAKKGNEAARELLIASNLRFVVQQANKFKTYTNAGKYTIMDLIQEGNVGLVWAYNKYNPESGYRFTTYAVWWIRAKIMDFITRLHSMVKIGTTALEKKLFFKMGKIKALSEEKNIDIKAKKLEDLSIEFKLTIKEIKKMEERIYWNDASTDASFVNKGKVVSLGDLISSDETRKSIYQQDFENNAKKVVINAMDKLSKREKDIIQMRWLGEDKETLQKIANKYGLSRERIRQIECICFNKLKRNLKNDKLGREIIEQL